MEAKLKNVFAILNPKTEDVSFRPYRQYLDMIITYGILESQDKEHVNYFNVTNETMENMESSEEELYKAAMENTPKLFEYHARNIEAVLGLNPSGFGVPMVIISNSAYVIGANVMFCPSILACVAKALEEKFYILPSSRHEIICIPCPGANEEELLNMVREVNENVVTTEDFLSNSVYIFDPEVGEVQIAKRGENQ